MTVNTRKPSDNLARRLQPFPVMGVLFVVVLLLLIGCELPSRPPSGPAPGEVEVRFLDVGQGDGILLRTHRMVVLVDGGPRDSGIAARLQELGIGSVDLMIATHAHADHIGGLIDVLRQVPVGRIWYNGQEHTTETFADFVEVLLAAGAVYEEPVGGQQWHRDGLMLEVLHPSGSAAGSSAPLHQHNIVVRAAFGQFSVLLTGDAEADVEAMLLSGERVLKATVLKVGHHGSSTSSRPEFVAAVAPEVAVYQAAAGNPFGHPHRETVALFAARGIPLYGTDVHGEITVTSDGRSYRLFTERQGPTAARP